MGEAHFICLVTLVVLGCQKPLLNHPPPARSTGGIPKCASGVQLVQVRAVLGQKRSPAVTRTSKPSLDH